jgi:hypothetical protein
MRLVSQANVCVCVCVYARVQQLSELQTSTFTFLQPTCCMSYSFADKVGS